MAPQTPDESEPQLPRFELMARRALLRRGLQLGAVAAMAPLVAACGGGGGDAKAFASSTSTTSTTAAAGAGSTTSTSTGAAAASTVSFTYTASDTFGRVRNPYIAVWLEDGSSNLVVLLGVWYSTSHARYLEHLTEFVGASGSVQQSALDAVTSATRQAGAYQLDWDGKGLDGLALTGAHTLWIEAAREHGPHSMTSGPVTLGTAGTTKLTDQGELTGAAITLA